MQLSSCNVCWCLLLHMCREIQTVRTILEELTGVHHHLLIYFLFGVVSLLPLQCTCCHFELHLCR